MSDMELSQEEITALFTRLGLLDDPGTKRYAAFDLTSQVEVATETSNVTREQIGEENA